MQKFRKFIFWSGVVLTIIFAILFSLSFTKIPSKITYGVTFSKLHSEELKLDWKKVFLASLDDLKIRQYRLSAHWDKTEIQKDSYNFADLDFQMNEAKKRDAKVILAVGRRLPGWPECHDPEWTKNISKEEKQKELLTYIEDVVNRYKDYPNLMYWQVENEPFLVLYARHSCGDFFDADFYDKETALVRQLDPNTPIFITDSGELSLWYQAYTRADAFGTSIYLYVWNHTLGQIRYPIVPAFFRIKHNIIKMLFKDKPAIISELSTEPWLLKPIIETPINEQLEQMNLDRFSSMISFASKTGFDTQYLWGVEWWYYMRENGHPEFWNLARELYKK
ncbi:MAG: cellulase family glycosylhydrolase [Candidatus Paceibacterota bacterium]